jgi:hypothetical protein
VWIVRYFIIYNHLKKHIGNSIIKMRVIIMREISSMLDLRNIILQLESRQVLQEQQLIEHFHDAYISMKPINIIKRTLKEVIASHEIQDDLINISANFAADFISKQITKGAPESYIKKYSGKFAHYCITTIVTNKSDTIRIIGECFIKSFFTKKSRKY